MVNGWISCNERMPTQEDGDAQGYVYVWHVFQGVMLASWNHMGNQFFVCWTSTCISTEAWIRASERKPAREDGDAYGCVLARDIAGNKHIAGWFQFNMNSEYVCWAPLPAPPTNYAERRKRSV